MKNPYPLKIIDETSGIEVESSLHRAWEEGYRAGIREVEALLEHLLGYFDEDSEPGRTIWKTLLKLGWEAR